MIKYKKSQPKEEQPYQVVLKNPIKIYYNFLRLKIIQKITHHRIELLC
jgi:hypothetical protein